MAALTLIEAYPKTVFGGTATMALAATTLLGWMSCAWARNSMDKDGPYALLGAADPVLAALAVAAIIGLLTSLYQQKKEMDGKNTQPTSTYAITPSLQAKTFTQILGAQASMNVALFACSVLSLYALAVGIASIGCGVQFGLFGDTGMGAFDKNDSATRVAAYFGTYGGLAALTAAAGKRMSSDINSATDRAKSAAYPS